MINMSMFKDMEKRYLLIFSFNIEYTVNLECFRENTLIINLKVNVYTKNDEGSGQINVMSNRIIKDKNKTETIKKVHKEKCYQRSGS